jgi:hypothetical protein
LSAKEGLAVAGEDLGDGHVGGALDLGIRIEERHAEPRGQRPAHRGLARPHHAHQNHGLSFQCPDAANLRRSHAKFDTHRTE